MSLTAVLFLLLFTGGLIAALAKHPIYGLFSYMLAFYFAPETAWWGYQVPDLRWSLTSGIVTLVAVLIHKDKSPRPAWYQVPGIGFMMLFVAWLWIQLPWVLSPQQHIFLATLFTKYLLIFAVVYYSLTDVKTVRMFALAQVMGAFIWGFTAYQDPGAGRLENIGTGDVAGSAFASMQMSTALMLAGFLFMSLPGLGRWIAFGAIPFILNAIILMETRGAFVGLVASVLPALYFSPGKLRKVAFVHVALAIGLLSFLAQDYFWERMSTIVAPKNEQMEASAASRFDIAAANLRMSSDYPFGVGHRGNEVLSPKYMSESLLTDKAGSRVRSAHNTELAILVDHGWIGLVLIALFHFRLFRTLLRLRKIPKDALPQDLRALTAALACSVVLYWANSQFANFTKAEVLIWIAATAGALEVLAKRAPANLPDAPVAAAEKPGRLRGIPLPQGPVQG